MRFWLTAIASSILKYYYKNDDTSFLKLNYKVKFGWFIAMCCFNINYDLLVLGAKFEAGCGGCKCGEI